MNLHARVLFIDGEMVVTIPQEMMLDEAVRLAPLLHWVETEGPQHLRDLRAGGFPWIDLAHNEHARIRLTAVIEALKPLAEAVAPDGMKRVEEKSANISPSPRQMAWVKKANNLCGPNEFVNFVATYYEPTVCGENGMLREELKFTTTRLDGGSISLYLVVSDDVDPPPLPVQFQITVTPEAPQ